MGLASSLRFEESIRRIRQWWKNIRDEGDQNQVGWVSHIDPPVAITTTVAESATGGSLPEAGSEDGPAAFGNSMITSGLPNSFKYNNKSDLNLSQRDHNNSQKWMVINQGYTSVRYGWQAEGDGLDSVVRFPKPTKPRTPVDGDQFIRCASILDMELTI